MCRISNHQKDCMNPHFRNNKEPLATKNSSNGISKTPKDLAKKSLCQNPSFCLRSLLIPLLEMPVLGLSLDLLEQTLWG